MTNDRLHNQAVEATLRFMKDHGIDVINVPDGYVFDVVATNDDELVFILVDECTSQDRHEFPEMDNTVEEIEQDIIEYVENNLDDIVDKEHSNFKIGIEHFAFNIISEDKALLRRTFVSNMWKEGMRL